MKITLIAFIALFVPAFLCAQLFNPANYSSKNTFKFIGKLGFPDIKPGSTPTGKIMGKLQKFKETGITKAMCLFDEIKAVF